MRNLLWTGHILFHENVQIKPSEYFLIKERLFLILPAASQSKAFAQLTSMEIAYHSL